MIEFKNKTIFFSGYGEYIDKDELIKFCIQKEATIIDEYQNADIIIQGYKTPVYLEEEFYLLSKDDIEIITIDVLEKEFSLNLDINSILMAIKISKDKERIIKLLKNRYFSDDIFIQILKYYDWGDTDIGIYDNDENRDVATTITSRFCSLIKENHNIQYSPIGIYYTALETTNEKLLEVIYNMPTYTINDKNAKENQPLTLKEVVALNPHSSKTTLIQIFKNNNYNELLFLAQNNSISELLKNKLYELQDDKIILELIQANNISQDKLASLMKNSLYKKEILKFTNLENDTFHIIFNSCLENQDFIYLSTNNTLNTQQIDILFEKDIDSVNINLLKNKFCSKEQIQRFLELHDKIYNIAIAHNESLEKYSFEHLFNTNDFDIHISLAFNNSTPKEILTKLYNLNKDEINFALSLNTNTPINLLMQLQLNNNYKNNVSNNPTYKEFSKNSLGIIQNQNSQFKRNTYMDTI